MGSAAGGAAPVPTSVVSRMGHGTAGAFDMPLPLTGPSGLECRSGGASGNYQLVVTFGSAVTVANAAVTAGTGRVSSFSVSGIHCHYQPHRARERPGACRHSLRREQ
jgi:hypothetical protein